MLRIRVELGCAQWLEVSAVPQQAELHKPVCVWLTYDNYIVCLSHSIAVPVFVVPGLWSMPGMPWWLFPLVWQKQILFHTIASLCCRSSYCWICKCQRCISPGRQMEPLLLCVYFVSACRCRLGPNFWRILVSVSSWRSHPDSTSASWACSERLTYFDIVWNLPSHFEELHCFCEHLCNKKSDPAWEKVNNIHTNVDQAPFVELVCKHLHVSRTHKAVEDGASPQKK